MTITKNTEIMKKKEYEKLLQLVMKYSNLGIEYNEPTKAIKIGPAPHIAPKAFLNCLYHPITMENVNEIESKMGKQLPKEFLYFLTNFSNGLDVLSDTLYLYGLRANYIRSLEMIWQPYSIIDVEVPSNATADMFFIGAYGYDGSKLYMDADGKVHCCSCYDALSLKTWDTFSKMIIEEIERIYNLYDTTESYFSNREITLPYFDNKKI